MRTLLLKHRLLVGLVGAIVLSGTAVSGMAIWAMRSDAISAATDDARNLTIVLGRQVTASIQSIELVIDDVQERLDALGARNPDGLRKAAGTTEIHEWLVSRLSHLAQAEVISVADRDGKVVNFTRPWPIPPIDVSDRDYFEHARTNPDDKLYISAPVSNKATGKMTVYFSKRLSAPNGDFLGVAMVGVGLDYFQSIYSQVDPLSNRVFAFLRTDGTVLLRYPGPRNYSGEKMPSGAPWYQTVAGGGGSYRSPGVFDGQPQLVAVEPLKNYPIVIDIVVSEKLALKNWYPRAIAIGVGGGVGLLCIGILIRMLMSQFSNVLRSEAELARRSREIEAANSKFDAALSNMPHGLSMFDADERLLVSNARYREIYELTEEQVRPGTPLKSIIRNYKLDKGTDFDADGFSRGVKDRAPHVFRLAGGRIISIRRTPMRDGGWVATHEDITEKRRSEALLGRYAAKLKAANDRFNEAIGNMTQGLCLFDVEKRLVISNSRFQEMYRLPDELVRPGTHLSQLIKFYEDRGDIQVTDVNRSVEQIATRDRQTYRPSDGRQILIHRKPLPDGGWVATHEDVTEQKGLAARLAENAADLERINMHFDAALNSMSQGLCLFDADQNVIVSNLRYAEIYHLGREQVKPGTSLPKILQARQQKGTNYVMDPEIYLAVNVRKPSEIQELADGRFVAINRQPMPSGGWLTVHEDITQRRLTEQERDRNREFLNQIIEHIPTQIVVKDARDRRYVLLNRVAEAQLGPSSKILGKTCYEVFSRPTADTLTARDDEALQSETGTFLEEHEIEAGGGGTRFITARRVSVRDENGIPAYLVNLVEDVTERKRANDRIAHLAHHDLLTGLANRARFADKLDEAAKRFARHGTPFTVFLLDLDKFKNVNDTLGHPAGDQLLVEVAQRLKSSLRDTDVLARLGGDEFAVIQEGEGNQREGAIALALRIIDLIAAPFDLGGNQANIGTSIGIAFAPQCGLDAASLLKKADLALYAAKSEGRNDYRLFEPEMAEASDSQKLLEGELRQAIQREEFELYYQPVVDAQTGSIYGAEALVRWRHPLKGLIFPDQFIPLAESTGLMMPLGEWILQHACKDAASWPPHVKVAINISAVQFNNANLFDLVLCSLVETGLAPERLELEITETMLLKNEQACLVTVRQLKNLGIAIVLDDFGIGYSSASYLTRVPFDKIKIDKSFIQGFPGRRECVAIVQSVLALGRGLDMAITAEGVETREQLEALRAAGVDLIQGNLIGRPVPLREFNFEPGQARAADVA